MTSVPLFDGLGAWCWIVGVSGRVVRTNSYDDFPDGARFVAVHGPGSVSGPGPVLLHLLAERWADPSAAGEEAMAHLWSVASDGLVVTDDQFGREFVFAAGSGAVRCCVRGSYVRVTDVVGETADGGSAYWVCDEWREEPELVMGAILGAARGLLVEQ